MRVDQLLTELRELIAIVVLMLAGLFARTLISPDPFDARRFAGEMILTAIGAVALHAAGILGELNGVQLILVGSCASLGGLRGVEWAIKIVRAVRAV